MIPERLRHKFTYHPPRSGQQEKYEKLRSKALELALLINELVPETPESNTAIERVEESIMWANAALSRYG